MLDDIMTDIIKTGGEVVFIREKEMEKLNGIALTLRYKNH